MKTLSLIPLFAALLLLGCADREKEEALQKQLGQAENDRQSYQSLLAERDSYLEGVMKEINDIYSELEAARAKEGKLLSPTGQTEGAASASNLDTRKQLLTNIAAIQDALKENRKKILDLQTRLKSTQARLTSSQGELAGLNKLVENLQATLTERENSIATLQAQVVGLEETVTTKTRELAEKDVQLEEQRTKMSTAYYVVAPREELEEKGIITEEGGFLWGLLGSTTVVSSSWDPAVFTALDKRREQTLRIPGRIAEILPRRNADVFALTEVGDNDSELKILQPEKFWKDNYLVVVLN